MTTSLRILLEDSGFDWDTGEFVYQLRDGKSIWDDVILGTFITVDHLVLDHRFEAGYGSDGAPTIIAQDKDAIYVLTECEADVGLKKIYKDFNKYLDVINYPIPYPSSHDL